MLVVYLLLSVVYVNVSDLLSFVLGGTHLTAHSITHHPVLNRYSFYHLYAPPCFLRPIICVISLMGSYYHRKLVLKITRNLSCVIKDAYHDKHIKKCSCTSRQEHFYAIHSLYHIIQLFCEHTGITSGTQIPQTRISLCP